MLQGDAPYSPAGEQGGEGEANTRQLSASAPSPVQRPPPGNKQHGTGRVPAWLAKYGSVGGTAAADSSAKDVLASTGISAAGDDTPAWDGHNGVFPKEGGLGLAATAPAPSGKGAGIGSGSGAAAAWASRPKEHGDLQGASASESDDGALSPFPGARVREQRTTAHGSDRAGRSAGLLEAKPEAALASLASAQALHAAMAGISSRGAGFGVDAGGLRSFSSSSSSTGDVPGDGILRSQAVPLPPADTLGNKFGGAGAGGGSMHGDSGRDSTSSGPGAGLELGGLGRLLFSPRRRLGSRATGGSGYSSPSRGAVGSASGVRGLGLHHHFDTEATTSEAALFGMAPEL